MQLMKKKGKSEMKSLENMLNREKQQKMLHMELLMQKDRE
jgi:hypothetical protein